MSEKKPKPIDRVPDVPLGLEEVEVRIISSLSADLSEFGQRQKDRQRSDRWEAAYEAGTSRWRFYQDSWVEAESDISSLLALVREKEQGLVEARKLIGLGDPQWMRRAEAAEARVVELEVENERLRAVVNLLNPHQGTVDAAWMQLRKRAETAEAQVAALLPVYEAAEEMPVRSDEYDQRLRSVLDAAKPVVGRES